VLGVVLPVMMIVDDPRLGLESVFKTCCWMLWLWAFIWSN